MYALADEGAPPVTPEALRERYGGDFELLREGGRLFDGLHDRQLVLDAATQLNTAVVVQTVADRDQQHVYNMDMQI